MSVGISLVLLGGLVGHSLHESRQQYEAQARAEAASAVRALQSEIESLLARIDLALQVVGREHERRLAEGRPDALAVSLAAVAVQDSQPDFDVLRVADATGRVVAGSDAAAGTAVGIGNRAAFGRLRDDPAIRALLDGPTESPVSRRRVLLVARRLSFPDGSFAGAAFAEVPIERIAKMLESAAVGPLGTAALRTQSLALVARHPAVPDERAGSAFALGSLGPQLAEGRLAGTFVERCPIDGREGVHAFRRLGAFGLVATVGQAPEDFLGHFRRDALAMIVEAVSLGVLAIGAAVMIHRSWRRQQRATRELARQARTDGLTGLANRRRFFELAEAELARAERYRSKLSVLMIDIDHFKEVNDAYGHSTGDQVLRELGALCTGVLREVDTVGRVGGEEFAILLPETDLAAAREVAERLRAAVAAHRVQRPEGLPVAITVSIGVAASEPGRNLDTLMSRSDSALYEAKRSGRNRVVVRTQAD
jgi:diguanylate cyclase (GGDEF)-like protein